VLPFLPIGKQEILLITGWSHSDRWIWVEYRLDGCQEKDGLHGDKPVL